MEREHQEKATHHATLRFWGQTPIPSRSSSRPIKLIASSSKPRVIAFVDPTARAGRMRQRDRKRAAAGVRHLMFATNELIERKVREKPRDRQPSNGNEKLGANQRKLGVEPRRARRLLGRGRHAISAAARAWTGITSRDRGDVDAIPRGCFVDAGALEPPKERVSCASRERSSAFSFNLARCLSDEHRLGRHGARYDRHYAGRMPAFPAAGKRPDRVMVGVNVVKCRVERNVCPSRRRPRPASPQRRRGVSTMSGRS